MNPTSVKISAAVLCMLFIWIGLRLAQADPAPATSLTTMPTTLTTSAPAATAVTTSAPSTAPSAEATTQPAPRGFEPMAIAPSGTTGRMPPMPMEYFVLLNRSMFVRGHNAEAGHIVSPGIRRNNPEPVPANVIRAESGLVFNGVTQTASSIDALVEDTNSGRVLTVRTGDALARGTVGQITIETLEYIVGGRTTIVRIGQNLSGGEADVSESPATTGPAPSGLSPQDVLEKLRQKRLQELGGGK